MAKRKWMTLKQLLEHVMKTKGISEEEAKAEILQALQKGELQAYGKPMARRMRPEDIVH